MDSDESLPFSVGLGSWLGVEETTGDVLEGIYENVGCGT
jgi:hypothetical protein